MPTARRTRAAATARPKEPFDIAAALRRVRAAVKPFPKAALFELADLGHDSAFEQVVACIISVRTRDEVMLPTARRLFAVAGTPAAVARLSVGEIDDIIRGSSFHLVKARNIRAIAERVEREFGGQLPADEEVLLSLPGVGPKCANLVLGIAGGQSRVGVDVHVHRVTNRWGYVHTRTPEQTMAVLEKTLPRRYRVEINKLLVPFGKHVCTGVLPKCSTCLVLSMCRQVGVTSHR
ncbi:MAG TPA: endonuclease III [Gemmataceae bacterium]|jgi:endonuclease-3